MNRTPQWMMRRLAARTIWVLERQADKGPELAAYVDTLGPVAKQYLERHDALRKAELLRTTEYLQGDAARSTLARKTSVWAAQVAATGAIPAFDRTLYPSRPDVAHDVIADGSSLVDVVVDQHAAYPDTLPFADALVADMTPAIEAARKELREAEQAREQHQRLVQETREIGEQFSQLLIAFRSALASIVGRNSLDYQSLRTSKIRKGVSDEEGLEGFPTDLLPKEEGEGEGEGEIETETRAKTG